MDIYIKTAGKNEVQDYSWYKIQNDEVYKNIDEIDEFEDVNFYFKRKHSNVRLYIKIPSKNRSDKWLRKINNYIYLEDDSKNDLIEKLASLYLKSPDNFSNFLDKHILECESDLGFCFENFVSVEVGEIIEYDYRRLKRIITYDDLAGIDKIISMLLKSNNDIEIVDSQIITNTFSNRKNLIFVGSDLTHLNKQHDCTNNKQKRDLTINAFIVATVTAVTAAVFTIKRRNKNGKN